MSPLSLFNVFTLHKTFETKFHYLTVGTIFFHFIYYKTVAMSNILKRKKNNYITVVDSLKIRV